MGQVTSRQPRPNTKIDGLRYFATNDRTSAQHGESFIPNTQHLDHLAEKVNILKRK